MERLTTHWMDGSYDTFDPIDIVDNEYSRTNYEKVLSKLGQYEDAEEQGLLLRLPCVIGTTVYVIARDCEHGFVKCHRNCSSCIYNNPHIEEMSFDIEYIDVAGKYIFLTREEAEQALAEMQEGREIG